MLCSNHLSAADLPATFFSGNQEPTVEASSFSSKQKPTLFKFSGVMGRHDPNFFGKRHQIEPGVSVFPGTWPRSEEIKAQDRAFKVIMVYPTDESSMFMGILDGVSGVKELSKSDLLVEYFAHGLCQAIGENPTGNFQAILNQGYFTGCMYASDNLSLFPPSCKQEASQNSSSTLSFVQVSCVAESTGPHQGKFRARIFTLGDSAVLVYQPKEAKCSFTLGQYIEKLSKNSSGKKKKPHVPGQISLYHSDYIHQEKNFSFDRMCEKVYKEKLKMVRKYEEHYLDCDDFVIAASDGLWDNLHKSQVIEILKSLEAEFPKEYEDNFIPYAMIITEIAKYVSEQPEGKKDDISIVVTRVGCSDIEVNTAMILKYQEFVTKYSELFASKAKFAAKLPSKITRIASSSQEYQRTNEDNKKRKVLPVPVEILPANPLNIVLSTSIEINFKVCTDPMPSSSKETDPKDQSSIAVDKPKTEPPLANKQTEKTSFASTTTRKRASQSTKLKNKKAVFNFKSHIPISTSFDELIKICPLYRSTDYDRSQCELALREIKKVLIQKKSSEEKIKDIVESLEKHGFRNFSKYFNLDKNVDQLFERVKITPEDFLKSIKETAFNGDHNTQNRVRAMINEFYYKIYLKNHSYV